MCWPTLAGSGTKTWLRTRSVFGRLVMAEKKRGDAGVAPTGLHLNLLRLRLARHLVVDPAVGLFQTVAELRIRLPAEDLVDQRVVAVAAGDALGGVEIVVALELHAGDRLGHIDELVDGHALGAAEVDRLMP